MLSNKRGSPYTTWSGNANLATLKTYSKWDSFPQSALAHVGMQVCAPESLPEPHTVLVLPHYHAGKHIVSSLDSHGEHDLGASEPVPLLNGETHGLGILLGPHRIAHPSLDGTGHNFGQIVFSCEYN